MTVITRSLYFEGTWQEASGADQIAVINPATEETIAEVRQSSIYDVQRAIASARRAFDEGPWPRTSVRERASVLRRMGDLMQERLDGLIDLNIREAGSVYEMAKWGQVQTPIDHWRDMTERVLPVFQFEEPLPPSFGPGIGQGIVSREPFGVAALITPYNFPILLNLSKLAPALAAGCTTVLKPAPNTPLEGLVMGEIADEAGLPPGVLNIVTGGTEVGVEMSTNPMVDIVSFTGSDVVGRSIYSQAASSMKKVILELGGKSALILCDDASISTALPEMVNGFTRHCGQGCSLQTRALVHVSLYEEVVERATQLLGEIRVGDPLDPEVSMGPLISAVQRAKVERLIKAGVDEGATIAFGGGRPQGLEKRLLC